MPYKDKEKKNEWQRQWYKKKYSNPEAKTKRRETQRIWREANKEKLAEYHKEWCETESGKQYRLSIVNKNRGIIHANRELVNKIKSNSVCAMCGENHIATLDFHHTDPNDKIGTINNLVSKPTNMQKLLDELDKCIILCSNCHRKLHWEERDSQQSVVPVE